MKYHQKYIKQCLLITIILFSSWTILACASTQNIPEPDVPIEQAKQTLSQIPKNTPDTMRINAKIDYVDGINNKRVVGQDLILSAQAPLNMRITLSAFDKAMATLVTDGTGFSLMDVSQNAYVTGMATPENIASILPVFLSAADLYRVINGQYPTDGVSKNSLQNQNLTWDNTEGGYKLSMSLDNGDTQHVFYSWPQGDIFLITVTNGDQLLYRYEASDFKTFEVNEQQWRYPGQIIFRLPPKETDVRLRVEKRDIGLEFSPAVFKLMPPAGAQIIVLP